MKNIFIVTLFLLVAPYCKAQESVEIPKKISVSKTDKFSGIKIYNHRDFQFPRPFKLYLSGQDTTRVLLLKCEYYGRGWIFFNKVIWLNERGEKIEFNFTLKELNRQVGSDGFVYEVGRKDLSYEQTEALKSFLTNTSNVDVRFIGDKYHDTNFGQKKVKAALEMIDFFYTKNKIADMAKEIYEMEQKLNRNNK